MDSETLKWKQQQHEWRESKKVHVLGGWSTEVADEKILEKQINSNAEIKAQNKQLKDQDFYCNVNKKPTERCLEGDVCKV